MKISWKLCLSKHKVAKSTNGSAFTIIITKNCWKIIRDTFEELCPIFMLILDSELLTNLNEFCSKKIRVYLNESLK